jgi:hypothetical protein
MSFLTTSPEHGYWRPRWVLVAIVVVIALPLVLLSMVLPLSTSSHTIFVPRSPSSGASVQVTVSFPTQVTVHFAQHNALSISYWVRGPGAMMGSGGSPMGGSVSYSFWSWGGSYAVGAGDPIYTCAYPCFLPTGLLIWANVTTGLL